MELVARGRRERALPIGADLGLDAEIAEELEGPPRDGGAREIEVERDLPVAAQVQAAGGVRERGKLGERVAAPGRRDARELLADVLRAPHR